MNPLFQNLVVSTKISLASARLLTLGRSRLGFEEV